MPAHLPATAGSKCETAVGHEPRGHQRAGYRAGGDSVSSTTDYTVIAPLHVATSVASPPGAPHLLEDLYHSSVHEFIRRKADRLSRQAGFCRSDSDDFQQILWLHLAEKWSKYDPAKGSAAKFAKVMIRRKAISILRTRIVGCRDYRRHQTLHRPAGEIEGRPVELADRIGSTIHHRRLRGRAMSDEDYLDLAVDIALVANTLTDRQRQTSALLMRWCVAEAARSLGVSRDTIHAEVRELRRRYEDAGLKKYLKSSDSFSSTSVVNE